MGTQFKSLFLVLCLGLLFVLTLHPVLAQSDSSLRYEITNLRSRVSRLESEISSLRGNPSRLSPPSGTAGSSPQVVNGELIGRSDPLLERLSTLLIELKERVTNLEKRLTQLEKRP